MSTTEANDASKTKPASLQASSTKSSTCRLQIRLPTGSPLVTSRPSEDTLGSVIDWVRSQEGGQAIEGRVSIPFPRKTFTDAEMGKSLLDLGLTPSSALIVN